MKSKNKKSLWFVYTVKGDSANYKQCTKCGKKYATDVVEYYSYAKGGPILIEKI